MSLQQHEDRKVNVGTRGAIWSEPRGPNVQCDPSTNIDFMVRMQSMRTVKSMLVQGGNMVRAMRAENPMCQQFTRNIKEIKKLKLNIKKKLVKLP